VLSGVLLRLASKKESGDSEGRLGLVGDGVTSLTFAGLVVDGGASCV